MTFDDFVKRLKGNKTLLNGGLFSIYSFFNEGIAFLLLILLANYIAPAEYGQLSLFNTIVSFMGFLIALSTQNFISVSYFKRGGKYLRQDFSSICFVCLAGTVFFCILFLIFGKWIAQQTNLPIRFIWIALIVALFKIFQDMWINFHRLKEEVGVYGVISCSFAILNLILSLFLVIKTPLNWEGRVYAQLGCTLLFGLLGLIYFAHHKLFTINLLWPDVKMIIIWACPLIPHLASLWLKQGGDRLIINHFHSIEDVGIYSFALNLTSIIIMIGNAFNNSNSVSIYQILAKNATIEEKKSLLRKQTRNIAIITISAYICVLVGAWLFIPLLLPGYVESLPYFSILSIQGLGQCFYFLFCNYLFYYSKNKQIMYVTFGTAVLHLGLSLLLTRYSLYYTCIIYVLTQALITGIIYNLSKKALSENL